MELSNLNPNDTIDYRFWKIAVNQDYPSVGLKNPRIDARTLRKPKVRNSKP